MILVVSPHFDDAALSVGQFLAGYPKQQATVLTIFAGTPSPPIRTSFDQNSGFDDSDKAMHVRTLEDDCAMNVLGARTMRAGFIDGQYRDGSVNVGAIAARIALALHETKAQRILGPLGLAHPDHVVVSNAVIGVAKGRGIETLLYEELPNRVLLPEEVQPRFDFITERGFRTKLTFIGTGPILQKQAAIESYASQQWCLDANVLYVPERIHLLIRKEVSAA